jgi:hypothetical protein
MDGRGIGAFFRSSEESTPHQGALLGMIVADPGRTAGTSTSPYVPVHSMIVRLRTGAELQMRATATPPSGDLRGRPRAVQSRCRARR